MNFDEMMKSGAFQSLLGQAKDMQARLAESQARAAQKRLTGEAGGGLVRVTVSGAQQVLEVTLDPVVMTDAEMLQDLIVAATNDALRRAREAVEGELGPLAGLMRQLGVGR
jgi:DNA-binding YbaB/EbfC family protein